ncbi:MAG: hypothetical protein QOE82_3150 [Thermoanaerobaculia bacterium]|nr:hypothetical protein [Thermoanaerobaculia bacterium]
MEDARPLAFIEVAADSVANVCFELGKVVCLGEDRFANCASGVPALRRFLNDESDLVHSAIYRGMNTR